MHGNFPMTFFSKEEKKLITRAVKAAEQDTSGEIRVLLVRAFSKDMEPLTAGKKFFEQLGMTRTRLRNGILFILELRNRRFILLGDRGIHEKVPENFWEEVRDLVLEEFKKGRFAEGLAEGIRCCGEKLKKYFPYQASDVNELPDEIIEK